MQTFSHVARNSKRTLPLAYSLLPAGDAVELSDDGFQLDLNALITNGREGFIAFTITGDSMLESIRPGDIVIVDTWREPKNGDVIVASVNGQNCIKLFQNDRRGLYLVSSNSQYRPKEIRPSDRFNVIGVVRGHVALYV